MKKLLSIVLMTAALLALCACGAAVPAVLESDTPPETSVSPSAEASETPTPEPTDAPAPTPPATPEPTEEPTPSPEPVPDSPLPSWEELQRTLYETNAYCAALYLGRSSAASLSDALPELLAQKGLDPRYGARPLRRLIRNQVENPAAELLLREDIAPGETLYLEEKGGQLVLSPLS